ncbi:MAG TPA: sigma-70 family RNA polymerase sigma factor [Polyangiaceae bacterium]|nr:sigma-70 family RNA polymerase sigma factor [Polyangiaceae bacterium]
MLLVREGSADALDQITRCYSERLLEAGRRHCRTGAEAEDAVQDALLVAAEHLTELRDDQRLEGWLVRVVASACRRIGRGRKNDSALHESEAEPIEASTDDPETELERRELGQLLERELLALAPRDRSILLLAELEDFSAAAIGAELGMTEGAVRTQLSRLRHRMAEALRKKNEPAV